MVNLTCISHTAVPYGFWQDRSNWLHCFIFHQSRSDSSSTTIVFWSTHRLWLFHRYRTFTPSNQQSAACPLERTQNAPVRLVFILWNSTHVTPLPSSCTLASAAQDAVSALRCCRWPGAHCIQFFIKPTSQASHYCQAVLLAQLPYLSIKVIACLNPNIFPLFGGGIISKYVKTGDFSKQHKNKSHILLHSPSHKSLHK